MDDNLSNLAVEWAEKLASEDRLKYRDGEYLKQPIGENILRVKLNSKLYFSGEETTNEWYKGESNYKYDGVFNQIAGNFTQIVWKDTKKVGFGFSLTDNGVLYAVANYYPAGNYKGQFTENVFSQDRPLQVDLSSWAEYFKLINAFKKSQNPKSPEAPVKQSAVKREILAPPKEASSIQLANSEFSPMQAKFIQEALKAHNDCRGRHGCPPLVHNKEISKIAQAYAERLAKLKTLKHSNKESRVYRNETLGENLSYSYDSELDYYSGVKATMQWYDEIKDHSFELDYQPGTGHFTQVVWKSCKEVGFGVAKANDDSFYAVANYYPAGNMIGRFISNVPRRVN